MANANLCTFIGNVGRDPELKYYPSGDAYCNLNIAVSETWKDKSTGEKKERTDWVPLQFNGKLAEIVAQYCKKGTSIYVTAKYKTQKTTKDGVDKYFHTFVCDNMQMLGGKSDDGQNHAPAAPAQNRAPAARTGAGYQQAPQDSRPAPTDDIPF